MTANGDTTPIDVPAEAYTSNQPSLPAAPTGLTATVTDVSVIKLAWTDVATSQACATTWSAPPAPTSPTRPRSCSPSTPPATRTRA